MKGEGQTEISVTDMGRKAESKAKPQSQVMAQELTKAEQDLPEINWKFTKNQEWGWDWNERPEEEKVSWAGLEKRRICCSSMLTPVLYLSIHLLQAVPGEP